MARHHLSRKLRTYQALYRLNEAFAAITRQCWQLQNAGFLPADKLQVLRGFVLELQSQITHDVCDKMHEVEDADMFRFGQVRIAREHYLNPEKPAFRQQ